MTREQAVKILKPMLDSFVDYANITMKVEDDNTVDALEMAIEALKQPEIVFCKDCAKHNKDIGDFDDAGEFIWKDRACPLIHCRGKAQGHEFDYQFCVYGKHKERRTDE